MSGTSPAAEGAVVPAPGPVRPAVPTVYRALGPGHAPTEESAMSILRHPREAAHGGSATGYRDDLLTSAGPITPPPIKPPSPLTPGPITPPPIKPPSPLTPGPITPPKRA
ncbi:hypothetical protein ABGB17_05470 [Sphaerisporangium sp. B11E5]|uniref:hypothetical protein n=1 Tax=Sphaerisporangium sp. B11E5 TaxID=3153563 RepID=UPI00325C6513